VPRRQSEYYVQAPGRRHQGGQGQLREVLGGHLQRGGKDGLLRKLPGAKQLQRHAEPVRNRKNPEKTHFNLFQFIQFHMFCWPFLDVKGAPPALYRHSTQPWFPKATPVRGRPSILKFTTSAKGVNDSLTQNPLVCTNHVLYY
jgi:hypothetical protein